MTVLAAVTTQLIMAPYTVTFVGPTLQGNKPSNSSWVYVNVTAGENLDASLLEWGNSSGFTNVSMANASLKNWFANMSGLSDGTYNYTVLARSQGGEWSRSERVFVTTDTSPPYELRACQDIGITNGSYILMQNVSAEGTCFTIRAGNVTLDGRGNAITYAKSSSGYAIDGGFGHDYATIKNVTMVQDNPETGSNPAVYMSGVDNGTIANNTIVTLAENVIGIYLYSANSNAISNNTIVAYGAQSFGINIYASGRNVMSNNTILMSSETSPGIAFDRVPTTTRLRATS